MESGLGDNRDGTLNEDLQNDGVGLQPTVESLDWGINSYRQCCHLSGVSEYSHNTMYYKDYQELC